MKHICKKLAALFVFVLVLAVGLSACAQQAPVSVVSIEYTETIGLQDIYTVRYSDGSVSTFTVTNGADGTDGADGKDRETGLYSVGEALQSSVRIYTEFNETRTSGGSSTSSLAVYNGSGVIWQIADDGYTYIVTDYHVVYSYYSTDPDKIAHGIYVCLYGSEETMEVTGLNSRDYGEKSVECEYVGGALTKDLAVIRAKTSDLKAVNAEIRAVTLADGYYVGQTAVAIGNARGKGISVTRGVISVIDQYVDLVIDGTVRYYRSIRIDTPIYTGNSGGGLFNSDGELIGITNSGNGDDQNINYAIPLEIVSDTVNNLLYYYRLSGSSVGYTADIAIDVTARNAKYIYDDRLGYGKICEEVVVSSAEVGSFAQRLSLQKGDVLQALIVNGEKRELTRTHEYSDMCVTLREGDAIQIVYVRSDQELTTKPYILTVGDFVSIV